VLTTICLTETQWQKARIIDSMIRCAPITWWRPLTYMLEPKETFAIAPIIRDQGFGDCDCACIYYGAFLLGSQNIKSFAIPCFYTDKYRTKKMHVVLGVPAYGSVIDPTLIVFRNIPHPPSAVIRRL
jgi:hypothetical protein